MQSPRGFPWRKCSCGKPTTASRPIRGLDILLQCSTTCLHALYYSPYHGGLKSRDAATVREEKGHALATVSGNGVCDRPECAREHRRSSCRGWLRPTETRERQGGP